MTTQRTEPTFWAVHLSGQDDTYPAPTREAADALLAKEPEPVAWQINFVSDGKPIRYTFGHNAIADFRQFDANATSTPLYATQPDLQARVEELERGIDMLAMLFDKYENGPSCYEEPDERTGYLGNAVRLDDPDFHRIADFLNKHRPVGAAQESGN